MSILKLAYVIALQRIIYTWKMEIVLFTGTILAVALMSSGVVFADLLEEASLRHTLVGTERKDINFSVRTYGGLEDPLNTNRQETQFQKNLDTIKDKVSNPIHPYLNEEVRVYETLPFFFNELNPVVGKTSKISHFLNLQIDNTNEDLILSLPRPSDNIVNLSPLKLKPTDGSDRTRPRGRISSLTEILYERATVIEGSWPYENEALSTNITQPIQIIIDETGRNLTGLSVGSRLDLFPAIENNKQVSMQAEIVGVFRKTNISNNFWEGMEKHFSYEDNKIAIVPFFTTDEAILQNVGSYYPGSYTEIKWFFFIDIFKIRSQDTQYLTETLSEISKTLPSTIANTSTYIKLDTVLKRYNEEVLLARIPLYLMVSLTTGILLYYLILISGLVIRSRRTETSLLKSRGITTPQMGILAFVEGMLISVPAIIIGPFVALETSRRLGNAFVKISEDSGTVPAYLSSQAILLGIFGALRSVAVLTIYTLISTRTGTIENRQSGSRPSTQPFIQKTYLDILAITVIGVIWWQIQERGSFLVRSLGTGELQIDLSLLLGPLLALLAIGLIVMRIFPFSVLVFAKVIEPVGPVWLVQGTRRVARDPIIPGSLVVLLMLTTSLGVIGSTFRSTMEQSQIDRALYAAGSDVRFEHGMNRAPVSLLGLSNLTRRLDTVDTISETLRSSGTISTSGLDQRDITILGIDTNNFEKVSWYRRDLIGDLSINEVSTILNPADTEETPIITEHGILLPSSATTLSIWVNPGNLDPQSKILGRVRDSSGYYFDILFGYLDFEGFELDSKGWVRLDADIFPKMNWTRRSILNPITVRIDDRGFPSYVGAVPPFTLQSIRVDIGSSTYRESGAIFLGELIASGPLNPEGERIEDHNTFLQQWHIIDDLTVPGLFAFEYSSSVTLPTDRDIDPNTRLIGRQADSPGSAVLSWIPGGLSTPSIAFGAKEVPMPAIVSKSLLEIANAKLGDDLTLGTIDALVPVRAIASTDYFPTLDPMESPFVVTDLTNLNHYTNLRAEKLTGGSNEMWISMLENEPGELLAEELSSNGVVLSEIFVADNMVSDRINNPLVNAGWGGLLLLMFFALVLASASGVMLYCYADSIERKAEYAILRTLGFTKSQLNGVVWFNLLLVMIFGIVVGTIAGYQIGSSILPVLEITEEGVRVTPPMILTMNWGLLLLTYIILGIIASITILWLSWITNKMDLQSVLRIGDN